MRLERVGVSDTGQVTSTGVSHVRVATSTVAFTNGFATGRRCLKGRPVGDLA
jgi:hypothetical protein